MYSVYILRSLKNGKRYIGWTRTSVADRLRQHRSGSTLWTKQNRPFELIYVEEYADAAQARQRERYLKTGYGRELLNKLIPR